MYKAIVGSRSHGIEIPESDLDISIVKVSNTLYKTTIHDNINNLISSESKFISDMFSPYPNWYFSQYLFPKEFIDNNALTDYIKSNREAIMFERRDVLYNVLIRNASASATFFNQLYDKRPKRAAYSILFYSILANYADGMPFAQAHKPDGELHDFLVNIRLGQIPVEEALARKELERLRVEKAKNFYLENQSKKILNEFEQVILQEIDTKRGEPDEASLE